MNSEGVDDDDPSSLLNCNQTLIADILSYVITSTKEFAKLREVCKLWETCILPYCLQHKLLPFLELCNSTKKHSALLPGLVQIGGERGCAGKLYEDLDVLTDMLERNNFDFFVNETISVRSMLIVSDPLTRDLTIPRRSTVEDIDFASLCKSLCATNSWDDFQRFGREALFRGMFLSVEDFYSSMGSDFAYETRTVAVILTLQMSVDAFSPLKSTDRMRIQVRIPKTPEESNTCTIPFVKYLNVNEEDALYSFSTFVGHNAKHDGGTLICQLPLSFAWWELMQLLEVYGLGEQIADSFLPLDCLWRTCEESNVAEGVAIVDGMLPTQLSTDLTKQLDDIAVLPCSKGRIQKIADPSLYAYVEGVSPLADRLDKIAPARFSNTTVDSPMVLQTIDFWGRKYDGSCQYQWLPTYFDVAPDGSCTICDYINSLAPRSEYHDLYDSLQHLFSLALPLLESVYSYCRVVQRHHLRMIETTKHAWQPFPPPCVEESPTSLHGQRLQVITQISQYQLAPGESCDSSTWQVDGTPHEEIVATAMYVLEKEDAMEGGDMQFKRSLFQQEANYIFSTIDRSCPCEVESIIQDGLVPLGQAKTLPGRLLVYPNCYVRRMTKLTNTDTQRRQRLRLVTFHLVNPEKRIVSTREVPMQQGVMPRTQALQHRAELLHERNSTKQDWNVRQIRLV